MEKLSRFAALRLPLDGRTDFIPVCRIANVCPNVSLIFWGQVVRMQQR
jgi:hypothetical protein